MATYPVNIPPTSQQSIQIGPPKSQYRTLVSRMLLNNINDNKVEGPALGANKLAQAALFGSLVKKSGTENKEYQDKVGQALREGYYGVGSGDAQDGTPPLDPEMTHKERMARLAEWGMQNPENLDAAREAASFVSGLGTEEGGYTLGPGMARYGPDNKLLAERPLSSGKNDDPSVIKTLDLLQERYGFSKDEAIKFVKYSKGSSPEDALVKLIKDFMGSGQYMDRETATENAKRVVADVYGVSFPELDIIDNAESPPKSPSLLNRAYEGVKGAVNTIGNEFSKEPGPDISNIPPPPGPDAGLALPVMKGENGANKIDRSKLVVGQSYVVKGTKYKWDGENFIPIE